MFDESDIGINQALCGRAGAALSHLASQLQTILERIARGEGSVLRFKLTSPLEAGSNAAANVLAFDEGGFAVQRGGTVFDEEPNGLWSGESGDEGWCTARDNNEDQYSIIFMSPISGLGGISGGNVNSAWLAIIAAAVGSSITTPSLYYFAYRAVEGFGPDVPGFGTACLDPSNTSGYSGAEYVCGDEAEVGIFFDHAETAPSTNGNFEITKAGTYRIEMTGTYKIQTGNTGSSAVQDLLVKCDLRLNGVLFSPIRDFQKFQWQQDSGHYFVQMSAAGVIYLEVGDRLAFNWQMSSDGGIPTGTLVALGSGVSPFIIATRLSAADMLSNNVPTQFP